MGNGYDFYLGTCLLPIAPEKLEVTINNANETITLINQGQVNLLKTPALTDISFTCLLPQVRYPFAVYPSGFQQVDYFLNWFERFKIEKTPFQFIVSRVMPNGRVLFSTNIKVAMEDYSIIEEAENGFDLKVKIKLRQYRYYGTKTVQLQKSSGKAVVQKSRSKETNPAPKRAQKYTVAAGDSLWNIAKRFYGDGAMYKEIYQANKSVIGGSPNRILKGQVLTIPPKKGR